MTKKFMSMEMCIRDRRYLINDLPYERACIDVGDEDVYVTCLLYTSKMCIRDRCDIVEYKKNSDIILLK